MLALDIILTQNDSNTQLDLKDITGSYSLGNLGGWGSPNVPVSTVTAVNLSGTFRPAPSNAPSVTIPTVELMPSSLYPLPYYLWQEFALTPSLLGLPTNNFEDGIYTLTYTVVTVTGTITFTLDGGAELVVGAILTDADGNQAYILTTNGTTTATYLVISGTLTDTAFTTNFAATGNITSVSGTTPIDYSTTQQFFITPNTDCCIGNKLSKIDPFCECGCKDTEVLFDKFMILMGSKAMCACTQNNSGLDALGYVQDYCAGCGCGCG